MGIFGMFDGSEDNLKNAAVKNSNQQESKESEDQKLRLRKEELDVSKNRVDIGKVEFGKEIIEEQQTLNIPVIREEVVIERKSINEPSDKPIGEDDDEHFSLSVSEEKVEVGKHTVVTGEITAHKREIEENREIKETIRREEARINKDGDANIVDDPDQLH
ncbi:MAG: YsnF/AvaK domain-containing protein [Syntrophomonas sp.]